MLRIEIEFPNLNVTTKTILFNYLNRFTYAYIDKDYFYHDGNWQIGFSHHLIKNTQFYLKNSYYVLGDKIESGHFGEIYKVIGIIYINKNKNILHELPPTKEVELCYETITNKVAKKILLNKEKIDNARREYFFANKCKVLQPESPIYCADNLEADEAYAYLVMRQLSGSNFENWLNCEKMAQGEISLITRIQLTILLLHQLKWQIHAKKIVHCDLKSSNVIFDINFGVPEFNYIDYGGCKEYEDSDDHIHFTRLYAPPECFDDKKLTPQSDLYCFAASILMELWHNKTSVEKIFNLYQENDFLLDNKNQIKLIKYFSHHPAVSSEIENIKGLSAKNQKRIIKIIKNLLSVDQKKRYAVEKVIQIFEQMLLQENLKLTPPKMQASSAKAFYGGVELRNKIAEYFALYKKFNSDFYKMIREDFIRQLDLIKDEKIFIRIFCSQLYSPLFVNCKDKQSILTTLDQVVISYLNNKRKLVSIFESLKDLSHLKWRGLIYLDKTKNLLAQDQFISNLKDMQEFAEACQKNLDHYQKGHKEWLPGAPGLPFFNSSKKSSPQVLGEELFKFNRGFKLSH